MSVRFDHLVLFAVGDFDQDAGLAATAVAARAFGVRVLAFGAAKAASKRALAAHGIDVEGACRSRIKAVAALEGMFGVWDAVLVAGGWEDSIANIAANEREQAFLDVRVPRPILLLGDPQYKFLRTPGRWAAFTAARAAGLKPGDAKDFVRQHSSGHKTENRDSGPGRATRTARTRASKAG